MPRGPTEEPLEPPGGGATDREARFREYVVPEIDVMLRVARSITDRSADAEDVVQDTLLRAYRAIDRFDGRHPRAWLLTILRNANRNRHRRRRPELLDDPDEPMRTVTDSDRFPGPEDLALRDEFDHRVSEALEDLPERFRVVVELVDIHELSYDEAASAMDIPIGTVMSRLHRARKRMRDRLVRDGVRPAPERS